VGDAARRHPPSAFPNNYEFVLLSRDVSDALLAPHIKEPIQNARTLMVLHAELRQWENHRSSSKRDIC